MRRTAKIQKREMIAMSLMTGEEYIESIRSLHMEVYMFGKRVENPVEDPILRPSLNSVFLPHS